MDAINKLIKKRKEPNEKKVCKYKWQELARDIIKTIPDTKQYKKEINILVSLQKFLLKKERKNTLLSSLR